LINEEIQVVNEEFEIEPKFGKTIGFETPKNKQKPQFTEKKYVQTIEAVRKDTDVKGSLCGTTAINSKNNSFQED
jgi:hypothetical protein